MSALELEIGKTYVDRTGDRHTIKSIGGNLAWDTDQPGVGADWYVNGGRRSFSMEHPEDLIAEVSEDEIARQQHEAALEAGSATLQEEPTSRKIPHADLIRAVLDGKPVQVKHVDVHKDFSDLPPAEALRMLVANSCAWKFRIKPEPTYWFKPGSHWHEISESCYLALLRAGYQHFQLRVADGVPAWRKE